MVKSCGHTHKPADIQNPTRKEVSEYRMYHCKDCNKWFAFSKLPLRATKNIKEVFQTVVKKQSDLLDWYEAKTERHEYDDSYLPQELLDLENSLMDALDELDKVKG